MYLLHYFYLCLLVFAIMYLLHDFTCVIHHCVFIDLYIESRGLGPFDANVTYFTMYRL